VSPVGRCAAHGRPRTQPGLHRKVERRQSCFNNLDGALRCGVRTVSRLWRAKCSFGAPFIPGRAQRPCDSVWRFMVPCHDPLLPSLFMSLSVRDCGEYCADGVYCNLCVYCKQALVITSHSPKQACVLGSIGVCDGELPASTYQTPTRVASISAVPYIWTYRSLLDDAHRCMRCQLTSSNTVRAVLRMPADHNPGKLDPPGRPGFQPLVGYNCWLEVTVTHS